MSGKSEDDYWHSSKTVAFNFDEEFSVDVGIGTKVSNFQTNNSQSENTLGEEFQRSTVPIQLLLSQQCIDKLLGQNAAYAKCVQEKALPVSENIKHALVGHPYILDSYRSLECKSQLLDEAVDSCDGNAIISVVLFLFRTLKKALAYQLLSTRPVAVHHYASYLTQRMATADLTGLFMLTGNSTSVGIALFTILVHNTSYNGPFDVDSYIKKLQTIYTNHYQNGTTDERDGEILKSYISLLEWQKNVQVEESMGDVQVQGLSVQQCLDVCCRRHWGQIEEHPCSPKHLAKLQAVPERHLHWLFLDVKTRTKSWDEIVRVFIKNNWFGNKKIINSPLYIECIVLRLGEGGAPSHVLDQFLVLLSAEDADRALALALRFKCHRYVINHYVLQRDRLAIITYKSRMYPHSDDYLHAEKLLRSTTHKWKN